MSVQFSSVTSHLRALKLRRLPGTWRDCSHDWGTEPACGKCIFIYLF